MSWTNAEKDAWVMETIEYLVMMTLSRLYKGDRRVRRTLSITGQLSRRSPRLMVATIHNQ